MKAITFLLHTHQPILATSLQGDPNSDVSHSYIPASMIRGMLISRYLRQQDIQELDILDKKIRRLFFDGQTRYLNAYLFDLEKEQRTLPVPLCLYKKKGEGPTTNIYNFIQLASEHRPDSPKRLDDKFCIIDEYGDISLYKESRRINIHNQRNRKKGRGTDSSGAVFRYDAIDAGQVFQAVILCDDKEDFDAIKLLLTPTKDGEIINTWLGGSQSAGYGHVTLDLLPDDNDWTEVKIDWEERSQHQTNLTVTLLSDTIIQDEYGQSTTDPKQFVKLISEALGTELKHIDTYASSLNVGGFNRKWGLPLPQVPALAAGSVFVFERPQELDLQKVNDLETQGIGERRVDGFGRVVFNWLKEEGQINVESVNIKADKSQIDSSPKAKEIAVQMAERLLRQKLDELLLEQVSSNTPSRENLKHIRNTQLSRLMVVARKALTEQSPDSLYELLGRDRSSSNLTSTARGQFERIEMRNGKKFDEQIRNWLRQPDSWILSAWGGKNSHLLNEERYPTITIAGEPKTIDTDLALEYTLRLIMAVAKKMMKDKNND